MTFTFGKDDLYIAPTGNDTWSGRLAEPNSDATDGPFATLDKARQAVREFKVAGKLNGPLTVWLRGGSFDLKRPVVFTPEDAAPVTYAAYPGEMPVLEGGTLVEGWAVEERDGRTVWTACIPAVAAGKWYFRQLWVGGERRPRARLPKVGPGGGEANFFWIEDAPGHTFEEIFYLGCDSFVCAAGDIQPWRNLSDVDIVALHFWVEERLPIATFDPATRLVTSSRRSIFSLRDDWKARWGKYYVENVFEALTEPGEWYLDRPTGILHYIPLPGETPENTEVFAPRIDQFLKLEGRPEAGEFVEFLRFQGLTFQHSESNQPPGLLDSTSGDSADKPYGASAQAAVDVEGVISLRGARNCVFEDCTIQHIGWYGVDLREGCQGNRLVGNIIHDMGAGGIKINGGAAASPLALRTGNNVVTDNHIHSGGRVFFSAVGIIAQHSFGNVIAHNHIHDLFYTGISCGWVWGYAESVSKNNRIEKNHIHDLGHGWLSDMGGIYTLGVQPGTTIRGNLIHDVEKANYGGWAVYTDEGSSHIIIENNIGYNTSSQPFHQHYGRENVVRNNIFAFGREAQIAISRSEPHLSITFERNIVVTRDQPIFFGGGVEDPHRPNLISDLNLFWNASGEAVAMRAETTLEQWRERGRDIHSLVADPDFGDLADGDFSLAPHSPALALGFKAIDVSDVGPRSPDKRAD